MLAAMGASTTNETELVESWHSVLEKHAQVSCALEQALREHGLGPSEYELLERLATSDCEHLRMQELAEKGHLSQSALSRAVGRLEDDGLVERAMCKEDRRGIFVKLTKAGRARHRAARPAHRRVLNELLA
jgi:DNA-binding MarR family transcriptional regulator